MNKEYNEGLGTVYEKLVLNDFFEKLIKDYKIKSVLEAPIFGMSGIPGMNSFVLAKYGCDVVLLDNNSNRIKQIEKYWHKTKLKPKIKFVNNFDKLSFSDNSFDLVWNFSALWYHKGADKIIHEMVRVSKKLIFISVTNKWQPGYFMRKYWLDKDFFKKIDEKWTSIGEVKKILSSAKVKIIREGVIDIPPFPDTCMPVGDLLNKIGIGGNKDKKNIQNKWQWTTFDYYRDFDKNLPKKIDKYTFLEKLSIPWQLKLFWAHHHYILGIKNEKVFSRKS